MESCRDRSTDGVTDRLCAVLVRVLRPSVAAVGSNIPGRGGGLTSVYFVSRSRVAVAFEGFCGRRRRSGACMSEETAADRPTDGPSEGFLPGNWNRSLSGPLLGKRLKGPFGGKKGSMPMRLLASRLEVWCHRK